MKTEQKETPKISPGMWSVAADFAHYDSKTTIITGEENRRKRPIHRMIIQVWQRRR